MIKEVLLASNIQEFKDNKDEAEMMIDSLSEFLLLPLNKQY